MAALEDILHLAAWNGYSEDTRQAMYVSYDAFTDERIMFPYGIRLRYGNNRGWVHNLLSTLTIAKDNSAVINRIQDVIKMAKLTHHMKLFKEELHHEDKNGESALIEAIHKISPVLVKLIVENGADVNQTDKCGRNILEVVNSLVDTTDCRRGVVKKPDGKYVIKNIYGSRIKEIRDYLVNNAVFTEPDKLKNKGKKRDWDAAERERERIRLYKINYDRELLLGNDIGRINGYRYMMMEMVERPFSFYELIRQSVKSDEAPKPKRLKSKQYKQQFGR